jgi:putative phage-type endonuclease
MPITEQQRIERRKSLGSSDMAAVLGLDPWKNAHDVWLDKTGQIEDLKENEAMRAGTEFEDGVLNWAEKEELGELERNVTVPAIGFPIVSNLDAKIIKNGRPVEAKTSGLFGPLMAGWGDAGSDVVPDHIIVQTHVHMLCTDREVCYVPTFLGGRGFVMYYVYRDKDVLDAIMDKSIEFWDQYVVKKAPPPDIMPTLPVIKRMRREPNKVVDIYQLAERQAGRQRG